MSNELEAQIEKLQAEKAELSSQLAAAQQTAQDQSVKLTELAEQVTAGNTQIVQLNRQVHEATDAAAATRAAQRQAMADDQAKALALQVKKNHEITRRSVWVTCCASAIEGVTHDNYIQAADDALAAFDKRFPSPVN